LGRPHAIADRGSAAVARALAGADAIADGLRTLAGRLAGPDAITEGYAAGPVDRRATAKNASVDPAGIAVRAAAPADNRAAVNAAARAV
jgi:hypothetical protein